MTAIVVMATVGDPIEIEVYVGHRWVPKTRSEQQLRPRLRPRLPTLRDLKMSCAVRCLPLVVITTIAVQTFVGNSEVSLGGDLAGTEISLKSKIISKINSKSNMEQFYFILINFQKKIFKLQFDLYIFKIL